MQENFGQQAGSDLRRKLTIGGVKLAYFAFLGGVLLPCFLWSLCLWLVLFPLVIHPFEICAEPDAWSNLDRDGKKDRLLMQLFGLFALPFAVLLGAAALAFACVLAPGWLLSLCVHKCACSHQSGRDGRAPVLLYAFCIVSSTSLFFFGVTLAVAPWETPLNSRSPPLECAWEAELSASKADGKYVSNLQADPLTCSRVVPHLLASYASFVGGVWFIACFLAFWMLPGLILSVRRGD